MVDAQWHKENRKKQINTGSHIDLILLKRLLFISHLQTSTVIRKTWPRRKKGITFCTTKQKKEKRKFRYNQSSQQKKKRAASLQTSTTSHACLPKEHVQFISDSAGIWLISLFSVSFFVVDKVILIKSFHTKQFNELNKLWNTNRLHKTALLKSKKRCSKCSSSTL